MVAMFVNISGRRPSIDASSQVDLEEKIFRNRPTRKKNCLWQTWLLTDRNEIAIFIEDLQ
jgi:hypothetical protein